MHTNFRCLRCWTAVALFITPLCSRGQSEDESNWNHFGIDFRLGLNIKTKFSNIGAFQGQPLPAVSGGVDHNYSDGFVRVDSSGDRGGVTWNWGYQNASQVSSGTLLMHAASTDGATSGENNNPRLGLELYYERDIGRLFSGRWGFKAALGFTDVKVSNSQLLNANVNLVTDAYSLGGTTPPKVPYSGSFNGPGPVISDTPTRTVSTVFGAATINGNRQLDAWVYDFRLGPYLSMPLSQNFSLQVSGGLAVGLVESTFSFADTTTTSMGATQATGVDNGSGAMAGFYGEASLVYHFVPGGSFFGGGQFQSVGEFKQSFQGRSVELDLRQSVYFVVGVQLHF